MKLRDLIAHLNQEKNYKYLKPKPTLLVTPKLP